MLKKLLNRMQTEQGRKNIKFALARKIFNPLLNHNYDASTNQARQKRNCARPQFFGWLDFGYPSIETSY